MSNRVPWFERTFNFDFPVGYCDDILERLDGGPVRVEGKVRGLASAVLTKRLGEAWSIQEHVGHFGDLEPLWAGRLEDFLEGKNVLRDADLTNRATHAANHNEAALEELVASFAAQRRTFLDRLEPRDVKTFARTALHPRLKVPMRLVDMCLFMADHDDYHLARITELSRAFGAIGV